MSLWVHEFAFARRISNDLRMMSILKNLATIQIVRRHVLLWLVLMAGCLSALTLRPDDGPVLQKISIKSFDDRYELTVPVSSLVVTIPKGRLALQNQAIGGATDSPRYFKFEDRDRGIIISGWFESA